MTDTVTEHDSAPRQDPRELSQERVKGTVDLDGTGAANFTVDLDDSLEAIGMGLFGIVDAGDGTAELQNLTPDSVDVDITDGTADQQGVEWELVISEDSFHRDSGDTLSEGSSP